MITRLQVDGFKNLVDVDVHFGKFNVVTGPNGIGKSNLFDVIAFLSNTTRGLLSDAAKQVRGAERDPRKLFFHHGKVDDPHILVDTDFEGLGSEDETPHPYRYELRLGLNPTRLIVQRETFFIGEQVLLDARFGSYRIFTSAGTDISFREVKTGPSTNTVLCVWSPALGGSDHVPTGIKEVGSWGVYNFDPELIRAADALSDEATVGWHGEHLPSALERIVQTHIRNGGSRESVLDQLSQRLFSLSGEIKKIDVKQSDQIESIWIEVCDPDGTWHNARALSDGTLRFLALAVLWLDPEATGVFCIEEPENGIHPAKLPALVRLLRDISEKPGCQVIVNTHSPALVAQTPAEDIIVAYPAQRTEPDGTFYTIPRFGGLKGTWRQEKGMPVATISQVLDYLDPIPQRYADEPLRLLDRDDVRRLVERRRKFTWEEAED